MDIRSIASIASQPILSSGQAGAVESVANAERIRDDSNAERRDADRSDTEREVGRKVDVKA